MRVRDQYDVIVWQDVQQRFANQFSIGISERLIGDFPYLGVGATQGFANGVKFRAPTGNHRDRRRGRVDVSCGGYEFGRCIVGDATLVCDVGEDACH